MMRVIGLLLVLVAVAECAPVELSAQEIQDITTHDQKASLYLNQMLDAENHELNERMDNDIQGAEPSESEYGAGNSVEQAASQVAQEEFNAVKNEDKQQTAAMDALREVKKLEPLLSKGEHGKDSAMGKAADKIKQVANTLEMGTKTSNTKALLERMEKQSDAILDKVQQSEQLGEAGVLADLNAFKAKQQQTANTQPEMAGKKFDMAGQPLPEAHGRGGRVAAQNKQQNMAADTVAQPLVADQAAEQALTVPDQARSMDLPAQDQLTKDRAAAEDALKVLATDEKRALKAELPEEAQVVHAEQMAIEEVKGMINKLA